MRVSVYVSVVLMLLVASGCSEPLGDTTCTRNEDCETGYACDHTGFCEEAGELLISQDSIPDAFIGESYSFTVTASGGIPDYTWSLTPVDSGDTRLDWIEMVESTGEIRNKSGEFPAVLGTDLRIRVTVKDMSNRGDGQEAGKEFMLDIVECRGDITCWEYAEEQGVWGCRQGIETCTDGVLSGQCVLSGWSTSTEHCGQGCGFCDTGKTDRCVQGNCVCGQTGGPCPAGEFCCSGTCTDRNDLNHCGACDTPCQPQHVVSASCVQGACGYDQCQAGYYDCDGNTANGCETVSALDNCGGCDDACTDQILYPNTTGHSCPAGVCEYQCATGYADCDPGAAGCETTLGTVQNCSGCGDACVDSAAGGKACIDDGGAWRCGCTSETDCDGDDMCCTQTCTPHDSDHCEDCDTGCSVVTGGPDCVDTGGGVYACQCGQDEDCRGAHAFSGAYCDIGGSEECLCTQTEICAQTVMDMCCFSAGSNSCVDLRSDTTHCGICRTTCEAGETCVDGACSCSGGTCPDPSGAPDCVNDACVCAWYDLAPCPAGQYCCDNEGCCLSICGTLNNVCSAGCITGGDIWCDWGCCPACQTESDCAEHAP